MKAIQLFQRVGLDLALWYVAPALFMLEYVYGYSAPRSAIPAHFALVGLLFGCLTLLRFTLSRLIPDSRISRVMAALVVTAAFSSLFVYYVLIAVGLRSWGGVASWSVILTVFEQLPNLADGFGVPAFVAASALILLFAGLTSLCWLYLRRFDWVQPAAASMSGWLLACVLGSGVAIMGIEAYRFSTSPWTSVHEPLSLTIFPDATAHALEGHSIDPLAAANMDRADDRARAAYVPATALSKRNLILIVVDALRPDHMGIYGYQRNTTPNLSRIAANGQMRVIRGVHATCGDTICGLLSLVTSKIPKRFSFRPFTLQEALRRNGYRVHMILSGDHTHFYSLKNYYGNVDTFYDGTAAQPRGFFLNDDQLLIEKLASMPDWDGVPAMFQFHVMSAHILRKSDTTPGPFQPAVRYLLPIRNSHDIGPGTEKVESATNYYDNGVVATDAVIAQLLSTFARKGYLQNTLVVITADHGESLGEHGLFSHANSVREELLRIPLVLISYGYQPDWHAVSRPYTSQIDVAPTLLDELGIPRPATWSGFPLEISGGPDFTYFEQSGYLGLLDHRDPHSVWKYWLDTRTGTQHAFDLSTDPGEDRDALHKIPPALLAEWRLRALSENTVDIETP